jgi:hypothetical protein
VRKTSELTEEKLAQILSIKICNSQLTVEKDFSDEDISTNIYLTLNTYLVFEWDIKYYKAAYYLDDLMVS